MSTQKKPNILFFFADQVRPDALGILGGAGDTPNLDSIAEEGVVFRNCYTPAPLCVPARICLATGKYAHTTGAWDNQSFILSPEAPTWMQCVRDAGYATSLTGKTHLHQGEKDMYKTIPLLNAYGYDDVLEVDGPHANCKSRNRMTDEWAEAGYLDAYRADMDGRKGAMVHPSPLPLELYYDTYVGRHGKQWLEQYDGDKPWFCTISFPGPHEPWDTPEPYASMFDPDEMIKPRPKLKKASEDRPRGIFDELEAKEKLHTSPETAAKLRADYAGGMKLIDDMIGEVLDLLRERGELDNTVIAFTTDHGELNGDYGLIHKRNYFHNVINVPLIIRTPETAKRGEPTFCDSLISMADIGPTLAEIAGNPVTYEQFARSLCPLIDDPCSDFRTYVLSECSGEIMYADKEWKIVINQSGQVYQLIHMTADPDETTNLAGHPDYKEIEDRLRLSLLEAVMQTTPKINQPVQTTLKKKKQ